MGNEMVKTFIKKYDRKFTEVVHAESPDYSTYISKGSRWQTIKYTAKGNPYVVRNHQRFPLDLFMVSLSGEKAYHGFTWESGLSLEIDPNGEMAMVRYEYTAHSSAYRKKYNW